MKNWKKWLSLCLSLMMVLTLTACGGDTEGEMDSPDISSQDAIESIESSNVEISKDSGTKKTGLNADFKAAMDNYENFMSDYVAFLKKYQANPSDLDLLSDYSNYMSKYADFVADFDGWEDKDLNSDELAYYFDVQARVSKKLLEVAQ